MRIGAFGQIIGKSFPASMEMFGFSRSFPFLAPQYLQLESPAALQICDHYIFKCVLSEHLSESLCLVHGTMKTCDSFSPILNFFSFYGEVIWGFICFLWLVTPCSLGFVK